MERRLFVAIDLPEDVRQRLDRMLRLAPQGVRAVRPEQMHLTLHFLGDVGEAQASSLAAVLPRIRPAPFAIDIVSSGCFPALRRATVLWLGVRPSAVLTSLHAALGDVLLACGLPVDSRPFVPHVTLARLSPRVPSRWVEEFLEHTRDVAIERIPVTAFTLFWSRRTDGGTEHVPLVRCPLDGGDQASSSTSSPESSSDSHSSSSESSS